MPSQNHYSYPKLTPSEQAKLPKLTEAPKAMPSRFEDSTHELWHCQTVDGEMVLKVCNATTVTQSPFWLGLNHLFGADFPNSLSNIQFTHDYLQENGRLAIPDFVASQANQFVLTRFVNGQDVDSQQVDDSSVIAMAQHIASLHQRTFPRWGKLDAPTFTAQDWATRLQNTLRLLAEQSKTPINQTWLNAILAQASEIKETTFVPMMLDLRWDQLRLTSENALALIDLDAFVIAPKNLDLVLLEYVLSPAQWAIFKHTYVQILAWPNNLEHQSCYQLLLFLMHVLGETDLHKWMQRV